MKVNLGNFNSHRKGGNGGGVQKGYRQQILLRLFNHQVCALSWHGVIETVHVSWVLLGKQS